ncbi:DHS-like NAD/FAD-binding domain-containing protein, partial [Diplogelasinospora grovesii]
QIVVVTGAGISTNARIPDFRSNGGLYATTIPCQRGRTSKTRGRDLFHVTTLAHAEDGPALIEFCTKLRQTARASNPTDTHRFIRDLSASGKLVRNYTQNVDNLEQEAGLWGRQKRWQPSASGGPAGCRDRGVECVQLHGNLRLLRCLGCGRRCRWDEERETVTLSGQLPICPFCAEASEARLAKGMRELNPRLLRPDILLYGEADPRSDEISEIIQHDLSLNVDLLLIFGTSLSVHGIQQLTKDFAEIVHKNGGVVVFVNLTEAAENIWDDVIDYWVEWHCDAWVRDLKRRKPDVWLPSGAEGTRSSACKRDGIGGVGEPFPCPASGMAAKKRSVPASGSPPKRAKTCQSLRHRAGEVRNIAKEWESTGTLDHPIDLTIDDEFLEGEGSKTRFHRRESDRS